MKDEKILKSEQLSDKQLEKVTGGIVSYPTKNNVPTDNDISEDAKRLAKFIGSPMPEGNSTGH